MGKKELTRKYKKYKIQDVWYYDNDKMHNNILFGMLFYNNFTSCILCYECNGMIMSIRGISFAFYLLIKTFVTSTF